MTRLAARAAAGILAGVLSFGWLLAAPASAENLTVVIDSPAEGSRLEHGTVTVTGRVEAGLGTRVEAIRVHVSRAGEPVTTLDACDPCSSGAPVAFEVTTPALDRNGPYTVEVVASGYLLLNGIRVDDGAAHRSFALAVRPVAPTGVKAEKLADNKVRLTWLAVPAYPDLLGYVVLRGAPGAPLKPLNAVGPSQTSYLDEQAAAGGTFHYKVASVREGAVPGDSSQWVFAESELAAVTVPPPSVPPTGANLPPGSGSGAGVDATGAASLDLGRFFDSAASALELPAPSAPSALQLPDTGFDPNLPFSGSDVRLSPPPSQGARPGTPVPGREVSAADRDDEESNRRALLVPVAAGSVLCVTALHLRRLSRRLALSPVALDALLDVDPAPPDADPAARQPGLSEPGREPYAEFAQEAEPVAVGAGSGSSSRSG